MPPTILSHRPTMLKTVAPLDGADYREGLALTVLLFQYGSGTIELDREELPALLRLLPRALLEETLDGQEVQHG
jgi:hypothetical protein